MTVPYPGTGTSLGSAKHRSWLGSWLLVGRVGWASITVSSVVLFLLGVPAEYSRLTHLSVGLRTAVAHLDLSIGVYADLSLGIDALYLIGSALIAWLILSRRPVDPMALFAALFLVSLAGATSTTLATLAMGHQAVDAYTTLLGALGYIGLAGLFYLFPDGRFVPRWTWIMLAVTVVGQVPFGMPDTSIYNPNSWPAPLKMPVLLGIFGPAVFAQIYRYRHVSDSVQRQQTKWVVFGASAAILLMFIARSGDSSGPPSSTSNSILEVIRDPLRELGFVLIPISIGISALRYRLWEIDVIINRTLVYGGLTAGVIGMYVLIVGYVGAVLRTGNTLGVSLLATTAVALLFQPFREQLQRGVNRLMYGERDDPYDVLSGLGKRLEASLVPNDALPAIVETVAQSLKLPYVAVALNHAGTPVVAQAHGTPVPTTVTLPLVYGAETVGNLVLGLRSGETAFSARDRRLLEDLARQAGVAAYAACLTADLQRSRERLVTAREEERRRLRRDLHDGLGPTLGSFSLKAGAARNALHSDTAAAGVLLTELIDDVQEAVGEIRRLVYNLRPPSLDELGLLEAIRAHAAQYEGRAVRPGLQVRIDAPHAMPSLPAAVEVAAYRIVQEALANVVRHAHARTCCIRLICTAEHLQVELTDDGEGLPATYHPGVGLGSMRERAEELSGSCTIEATPQGGTQVRADFPLPGGSSA